MGCKGCGKQRLKSKEEMAKKIQKALFDFTSTECGVLVLGCGTLVISYKTDMGESEMYLKLKPNNGYVNAEGSVFHPTNEVFEFKMTLMVPDEENAPLDDRHIKDMEGKYIDRDGNEFELSQ
jgi:hypothetical protein